MRFNIIASGSKGNMTIIEGNDTRLLLDAGISLREAKRRFDFDHENFDGIIISHEHSDHVQFLITIAKRLKTTIYITKESFEVLLSRYKEKLIGLKFKYIEANTRYKIKNISFLTLRLSHDAASCLGFIFFNETTSFGYITDTGFLPIPYINLLKRVDALVIEANHDVEMLHNSNRPWTLKERIFSVKGHMSNYICGQVLNSILEANKLKLIVLAHLSTECNTEELAVDTILELIKSDYIPKIVVAKQTEATGFLEVSNGDKNYCCWKN
ncbi:MAG TPA: MBL fold metallo-hydrolase [Acholeplasmataceae bacterium]|jgi:phosphoribosyl 1,2-cyclic phosphodiesterase|nr:MBL fold metallo-hydrolase [Acholeplasmataceae bacterium]